MNQNLFKRLHCIYECSTPLEVIPLLINSEGNLIEGILYCKTCLRWYPIKENILRMLPDPLRSHDELNFLKENRNKIPQEMYKGIEEIQYEKNKKGENWKEKRLEMVKRDEEASIYHKFCDKYTDLVEVRSIMNFTNPNHSDSLLEIGAGTGRILSWYVNKYKGIVVTDYSINSLLLLKQKYPSPHVQAIQCDVTFSPFVENSFDNVISAQVLEHISTQEGRQKAVENMFKAVKPNGRVVLTVYNYGIEKRKRGQKKEGYHDSGIYYYNFNYEELKKLLSVNMKSKHLFGIINYWPKKNWFPVPLRIFIDSIISKTSYSTMLGSLLLLAIEKRPIQSP